MKATIENVQNGYLVTLKIFPKEQVPLEKRWIAGTREAVMQTLDGLMVEAIKKEGRFEKEPAKESPTLPPPC